MKICLLTRFFDLRNGGIGRFSIELRGRLIGRGHDVTCISDQGEYNKRSYLKYTLFDLRDHLPRDCDVYHCLTPLEARYVPKNRAVVTFHDLIPWLHSDRLETHYTTSSLYRWVAAQYFRQGVMKAAKARWCVADSAGTADELLQYTNVARSAVRVIRPGIRPDLQPKPKRDNTFRVGTLSYLDRRKRVDLLIRAFLEANVDGELVIGGKGIDENRLRFIAGGDPRIKFLGFVPDDKLIDFYNSLDLFVFPTKIEGYGLPIVEAMACGKRVVVMLDAQIPFDIKKHCLVTHNLRLPLSARIGSTGTLEKLRVAQGFARSHSWDKCAEEYQKLYEQIA